jgi:threonine/homoserine/homoserine lactone efflux protein
VDSLVAFAIFAALLTITPGLDTVLVLRASAAGGRVAGIGAAVGINLGCLIWATASAVGVTAILSASRLAFEVLRIAGVAYLCWLGIRALWSAGRRFGPDATDRTPVTAEPVDERWSKARALRTGLTTNLLNPKIGAFYLSVLPQFLPDGLHPLAGSLLLALIHDIEGLLWLSLLAFLVHRARDFIARPTVRRRLEQVTGVVFIGFGIRLALDHAP